MDPEMFDIVEKEKKRQQESVDLIPSEVSFFLLSA
jgi:glycine hydroxymethyltransferase